MNSGDLIAEMLVGHGVKYAFGMPAGQTWPLFDAISRSRDQIEYILVRDERSGPYAADAYARVSGKVATCDAVPGPGVIKLPSGLAEAYYSSIPLVAIAADLPRDWQRLARYACAAQGLDQVSLLKPVSKAVIPVNSQGMLPEAVRQAFREATTGRAGPAVLNIPADVMHENWDPKTLSNEADPRYGFFPAIRVRPPADAVDAAARVLLEAERPLMIVGGGGIISQATKEIQTLAEMLSIPVVTTASGKGAIAEDHALSVGVVGGQYGEESANEIVRQADVIFLIGFKSSQQSTFIWKLPTPQQRLIHLDIDPYEIGKVFRTEVGLVADAAAGLADLLARLSDERPPNRSGWLNTVSDARARWLAETEAEAQPSTPIRPQQVMRELERRLNPRDILVTDASFSIGWVTSFFDIRQAGRRCVFPRGSGTLGYGLPAAIGARLADPDCHIVCIAGDGGSAYSLGELATCRKYNLRLLVVVLNNSCLGYCKVKWIGQQPVRSRKNVDFPATDFAAIARAFGCTGLRIETPDQVGDVLSEALNTDGPVVVDVVVDEFSTPEISLRRR